MASESISYERPTKTKDAAQFYVIISGQFLPITHCLVTTVPEKESLSGFSLDSLWILEGCYEVSIQPSLLNIPNCHPVFIRKVLQFSYQLHGPPLDLLQQFHVLPLLGDPVTQGTLKGFDQTINLILDESHERVFSSSQGVEQVVLGLYIVRGDNVAVIGEIDEETDSALDLGNIRAEPLNSVVH
ncbi:hypothetical protein HGM15179_007905 [Zosterops borbonicus]|uniref:U6 snRNA-associated Sm-like protein LSm8 n=1 Tax=Zosterops borbonicus TaxID=364589 RepID=A0A8K1LMH0_9PASS|nr:hypothetical protein HGM15179_007905 [Zosterops borbonicus]